MNTTTETDTKPTRESREWWAVRDDSVRRVTGLSCAPHAPQYWYCPEIGSSLCEGHHLFATEAAAIDKLNEELVRRMTEASEMLVANRQRRAAL